MSRRVVVWFSCGATSAVAAKLVLADKDFDDVVICYTDPGSEHPDNVRFLADCENWFGRSVTVLRSDTYRDTWDVWTKRRFLNSPQGALCTVELKKKMRMAFERPDDIQVFGYDVDERERADRFVANNPDVTLWTPLVDRGLTHADCLAIVERAGIELPVMYRQGYGHNNCVGCVKGGMGYWNRIRVDYPDVFDRMAKLERDIGATCIREPVATGGKVAVYLDELEPDRGNFDTEPKIDCSLLCAMVEDDIAGDVP